MKRLLTLILLFNLAAAYAEQSKPELVTIQASQREAMGIETAKVGQVTNSWSAAYPAKVVVPNAQLRVVSASQGGLLESLLVAEGENVKKGQALAVILSPGLLEHQSAYLESLTDLNLVSTELKRDKQLSAEGIIAKRRYLESSAKYTQIKNLVEQRRQTLMLSGMSEQDIASLKKTRQLSAKLTVRAPLNGVILKQSATPGTRLEALDPIYQMGHLDPLWLEIHVPLEQIGGIQRGTQVKVEMPEVEGKVITVGRMIHTEDQGVLVRAETSKGAEALRPGQFVQAKTLLTKADNTYRISRNSIIRNEGKSLVFVAKDKGFLPVEVTIINEETDSVVVSGDLNADSQVTIAGTIALKAAWLETEE